MFGKGKKKKGKDDHESTESEAAPAPAPEGEGAEGEAEAGGKKKLPLKMIIIIAVAALLVVGGGGGAAWFFLLKPKPHGDAAADAHGKEKPKKKEKEKGHGGAEDKVDEKTMGKISEGPEGVTYFTMPKMLVNIQTSDGRPSVLGLTMTFEMSDEEGAEVIRKNMPRVQDMLQTFLRELRPEDLNGSQGSYRLKQEILRRMNLIIAPAKINAINMEEMVVQ